MECRAKKGHVNHRRECKTQERGEKPSLDIKIKPPQWRLESISQNLTKGWKCERLPYFHWWFSPLNSSIKYREWQLSKSFTALIRPLSTRLMKPNLFFTLPPMQHHSFFRNSKFVHSCCYALQQLVARANRREWAWTGWLADRLEKKANKQITCVRKSCCEAS